MRTIHNDGAIKAQEEARLKALAKLEESKALEKAEEAKKFETKIEEEPKIEQPTAEKGKQLETGSECADNVGRAQVSAQNKGKKAAANVAQNGASAKSAGNKASAQGAAKITTEGSTVSAEAQQTATTNAVNTITNGQNSAAATAVSQNTNSIDDDDDDDSTDTTIDSNDSDDADGIAAENNVNKSAESNKSTNIANLNPQETEIKETNQGANYKAAKAVTEEANKSVNVNFFTEISTDYDNENIETIENADYEVPSEVNANAEWDAAMTSSLIQGTVNLGGLGAARNLSGDQAFKSWLTFKTIEAYADTNSHIDTTTNYEELLEV